MRPNNFFFICLFLILSLQPKPHKNNAVAEAPPLLVPTATPALLPTPTLATSRFAKPIAPLFTPEIHYWQADITKWAMTYQINPNVIATIMQIESCGNPYVVASSGASGLFQVMPLHFEPSENALNPATNARRALQYYNEVWALTNKDQGVTFAAYNGGLSVPFSLPNQWHAETQRYFVLATGIFEEAEAGLAEGVHMQDWYDYLGRGLCLEASQTLGSLAN